MSSGDGKRTVPDVITAFHYIPEKHVLCAATSLTCRKSDVSVVTFASCAVVRNGEVTGKR